jgi:heme oxygenase
MSLKELTAQKHRDAERTAFAQLLLSGNMTKEQYAVYLMNMLHIYWCLEYHARSKGLWKGLDGLERSEKIHEDLVELNGENHPIDKFAQATLDYHKYLDDLGSTNPEKLLAHVYVRHMGDLYGGQMIARKVPGSGKFYQFDNPEQLKTNLRALLSDDLADEANVAFDYAISIMKGLTAQMTDE